MPLLLDSDSSQHGQHNRQGHRAAMSPAEKSPEYATNLPSPVVWQQFSGNPATNVGNFHQAIGQPVGSAAFFRLSTGSP